jgi:nickel-dependent lactate racemase
VQQLVAFDRRGLNLSLPEGFRWRVLETRLAKPLADPAAAIEAALDTPVAGPPLAELARGRRSAAISVCDITRPVPNRVVLPHVLKRLESAGISRDGITFMIATGLHRPATAAEIDEILGPEIARGYRVLNHRARELGEHRYLGATAAATPVYIDERYLSADLHLSAGLIEPHLMLGFSGGRKLVVPGMAGQDSIKRIHSPHFMRDPLAVEGSIEGNTLHRELLEIARMARHDFMIDVSITRDREISGVFAGSPEQAHAEGVRFVAGSMLHRLESRVDAAITTSAGYPLDLTFYQAIKGVTAASQIVKPGGRILLLAACTEGCGSPEFTSFLREGLSDAEYLERISDAPVVVDQWQLEKLALVTRQMDVLFYVPGLAADFYPMLWGKAYETPRAAVAALLDGLPPGAEIAIIPEGPYVLAKANGQAHVGRRPDLEP